jgi:hypothetical protein
MNNHGDKGWLYYDERKGIYRWTKGFRSRPFMYNTARELERKCIEIAKERWLKTIQIFQGDTVWLLITT